MKCFYHNDLDGQAAAFCVHAWAGITGPHEAGNMLHSITYGDAFPFDIILPNEQVWIVDYSIQPEEMKELLLITKNVTWIDHHKTAIDKYDGFGVPIDGVRLDGVAGCILTWKYLHWWSDRGRAPFDLTRDRSNILLVPRMIELVGDRDVWNWDFGNETKYFFNGSGLHDTSPQSVFWWDCMDHEIEDLPPPNTGNRDARIKGEKFWSDLLKSGEVIEKYKIQSDKGINDDLGFECEFEGYKCWAVNRPRVSSDRLGGRSSNYDIVMPFCHDGKQWTVSLYSEKVDVSVLAKARGGGGHVGAAGFQCDELPIRSER